MHKDLKKLRKRIDKIDKKLEKFLEKREKVTMEVGEFKKKHSLSIEDLKREKEVLSKMNNSFVKKVFAEIIRLSKKTQS
jgi:chorismate mutase